MKEFYKIIGWSVGALGILVLTFTKSCKNSMAERNSRYSVTNSSKLARETGVFVKTVMVSPRSFTWRGKVIPIEDTWIERASQVNYTLLFFKSYQFFDEYKLVVVPGHSPETKTFDLHFAVDTHRTFQQHNHGAGAPYELVYDLGSHIPESLKVLVLEKYTPIDTLTFVVES